MIYPTTRLKVADNTGARSIMCIQVLAGGFPTVVQINEKFYENVKVADVAGILDSLR